MTIFSTSFRLTVILGCLFLSMPRLQAEITVGELPQVMSDFAINKTTGDLAAVSAETNRAYLFHKDSLAKPKVELFKEIRVGDTPCGITYKRFGDQEMFAVVCTQASHMYVIDAKTFDLLKKIPLPSAGVSGVQSSVNPKDPFLYYNFGGGHSSAAGAVDVRKMVDAGQAFNDSMDCAISADGKTAYRRGPWSPSGFESLRMTSDFSDDKPTFSRLFHDHRSTAAYYPDPFGKFTASGKDVFTKGLEKKQASLSIVPRCFFKNKPVVIGLTASRSGHRSSRDKTPPQLGAVSYNTLSSIGDKVTLPAEVLGEATALPRGGASHSDFKRVKLREEILADDKHSRIIYAFRNNISLIPLEEFELPEEPFMLTTVTPKKLTVGKPVSIKVTPADSQLKLSFDDLPEGMVKTPQGLQWTPTNEHVGEVRVPLTVSFKDVQRIDDIVFEVNQPYIQLPFEISQFVLDDTGTRAFLWKGPTVDRFGRLSKTATTKTQLAVVSQSNAKPQEKTLPYSLKQVILIGKYAALLPQEESSRVEIFDTETLTRAKTLLATSKIVNLKSENGQLQIVGEQSTDVYDLSNFKRVKTLETGGRRTGRAGYRGQSQLSFKDGKMLDGVLYDPTGEKPQLLVSPMPIKPIGGRPDSRLYNGRFLRQNKPSMSKEQMQMQAHSHMAAGRSASAKVAGPLELADGKTSVSIERSVQRINLPNAVHTNRSKAELFITVSKDGSRVARIPLHSEILINTNENPATRAATDKNKVFVAYRDRLYAWSAAKYTDQENQPAAETSEPVKFHFSPQQAAFSLDQDTTVLPHPLKGGKAPFEYFDLSSSKGVTVDERTGKVTIQRSIVEQAAQKLILAEVSGSRAGDIVQQFRKYSIESASRAKKILGRKPTGVPFAIPIHLKAIDQDGQIAEIQYFVILESNEEKLMTELRQKSKEAEVARLQQQAKRTEARNGNRAQPVPSLEVAKLQKRIDSLEAKVDLLIMQMSTMSKALKNSER